MSNRAAVSFMIIVLAVISGCGPAIVRSSELAPLEVITSAPARAQSPRAVLASAEISRLHEGSMEDALLQLRPQWLRANPSLRHVAEPAYASVYIDHAYAGELRTLRLIPASVVIDARYFAPSAAFSEFGSSCRCPGGVIRISTRHQNEEGAR
jgi:hypothetical protein